MPIRTYTSGDVPSLGGCTGVTGRVGRGTIVRPTPGVAGGTVNVGTGEVIPGVMGKGDDVTDTRGVGDPGVMASVRVGVTPGRIVAVGEAPGGAVGATTVGVLVAPGAGVGGIGVAVGTGVAVAAGIGVKVDVGVADGGTRVAVGVARMVGVAVGD